MLCCRQCGTQNAVAKMSKGRGNQTGILFRCTTRRKICLHGRVTEAAKACLTCDIHGGLCGPIQVVELRQRQLLQELGNAGGGERLSADKHSPQRPAGRPVHFLQSRTSTSGSCRTSWTTKSHNSLQKLSYMTSQTNSSPTPLSWAASNDRRRKERGNLLNCLLHAENGCSQPERTVSTRFCCNILAGM